MAAAETFMLLDVRYPETPETDALDVYSFGCLSRLRRCSSGSSKCLGDSDGTHELDATSLRHLERGEMKLEVLTRIRTRHLPTRSEPHQHLTFVHANHRSMADIT